MKYRPEIDGLRAIAVLAVVLYHAGIGRAGFVGVDVFFVISGYLISRLLLDERRKTGRIDFAAFYARRVRRILPASVAVILATLAASRLLDHAQQVRLADSAGAALTFTANVFFQLTTGGYFDGRSEEMPLLHLWSLSVEEQFYLLWPALVLLVPPRRLRLALGLVALASIGLAEYWIARGSNAAFFQMPARAWELAAGGFIAAGPAFRAPRWLLPAGMVATLAACAVPAPHFPGVGALPAVLGACAIIAAVHAGRTNQLLASRPMVGIGLVSYSLYLWHWPLLAFHRATSVGESGTGVKLMLCAIAMLLAIASFRYVETPFRHMRRSPRRTVAAGVAVSAILALPACAFGLLARQEVVPARTENPLAAAAERDKATMACHISGVDKMTLKCSPRSRVLVYGDSMAWSWLPAVRDGSDVSMDACPPFLGYLPAHPFPGHIQCRDHNAVVAGLPADVVVIAGRWLSYGDARGLAPTLDALARVPRVIVVGPTPELRDLAPRCIRRHAEAACAMPRAEFDAKAKPILARLRALAASHPNVEVFDPTPRFCTSTECPPVLDGIVLYWDAHHLTTSAARRIDLLH